MKRTIFFSILTLLSITTYTARAEDTFTAVDGEERQIQTQEQERADVLKYLNRVDPNLAKDIRFFSLRDFYNNPNYSRVDLMLATQGMAKTLNSLSHNKELIGTPESDVRQKLQYVNKEKTLLAFNVRALDGEIRDPHQGVFRSDKKWIFDWVNGFDPTTARADTTTAASIYAKTGTWNPIARGSFFSFAATQPPFYDEFLYLPDSLTDLEYMLGVDRYQQALTGKPTKPIVGFAKDSEPSKYSRYLIRFQGREGYLYESDDFDKDSRYETKPLPNDFGLRTSFENLEHQAAGGEHIFQLPNGLQAYFLTDGKGKKIAIAPNKVVTDLATDLSGNSVINGLSCVRCHEFGMWDFENRRDLIVNSPSLTENALKYLKHFFPEESEFTKKLEADERTFTAANERAGLSMSERHLLQSLKGYGFQNPESEVAKLKERESGAPDPFKQLTNQFLTQLTIDNMAAELGLTSKEFTELLSKNKLLKNRVENARQSYASWANVLPSIAAMVNAERLRPAPDLKELPALGGQGKYPPFVSLSSEKLEGVEDWRLYGTPFEWLIVGKFSEGRDPIETWVSQMPYSGEVRLSSLVGRSVDGYEFDIVATERQSSTAALYDDKNTARVRIRFARPEQRKDTDQDGTPDEQDDCSTDPAKTEPGTCGCGLPDSDGDRDGTIDCQDMCPSDPSKVSPGACGCGVTDVDANRNGIVDCQENKTSTPSVQPKAQRPNTTVRKPRITLNKNGKTKTVPRKTPSKRSHK